MNLVALQHAMQLPPAHYAEAPLDTYRQFITQVEQLHALAVEPDHKDYLALMGGNTPPANVANAGGRGAHAPAASGPAHAAQTRPAAGFARPAWAQ